MQVESKNVLKIGKESKLEKLVGKDKKLKKELKEPK